MHLSVGTSVAAWEGGTTTGGVAWGSGTGVRPHDFPIAHPPLITPVNSLLSSHRLTKRSTPTCPGAFQDGEHAHIWYFRMPPQANPVGEGVY